MLDGTEIVVSVDRETDPMVVVFTNGRSVARVDDPRTQLDIVASNGIIHAIDRLLVPPGFVLDPEPAPPTVDPEQVQPAIDPEPREVADASTAQGLEQELNALVAANPVRFEPGSAVLTPESNAVVAELAELARRLDGISLEVVGHTDSDGGAPPNQRLSEDRANTVRLALVLLGLDPDQVTARGAGETEPILVDGVEDAEASRRVEFVVDVSPA
jgi:OOP family OmpA-OmpF porin